MAKKTYSGYTNKTAESLLLDAGAFLKNFTVGEDTFDAAVEAGKLLGATTGGGTFTAVPTMRKTEIDGVKGAAKGMQNIDEWNVTIMANMKELTKDVLVAALGSGSSKVSEAEGYDEITAANYIPIENYIENITWVGRLSGSEKPIIIQIYNALSVSGLTLSVADKSEAVLPVTFTGHYDQGNLDEPPFKIFYPKSTVA